MVKDHFIDHFFFFFVLKDIYKIFKRKVKLKLRSENSIFIPTKKKIYLMINTRLFFELF